MNDESSSLGLATGDGGGDQAVPISREPRRERARKSSMKIDNVKIAQRVLDFVSEDESNRAADIEARLQRYAKFRMWTEGKDWPFENCSDAAIPDMMTHSLKVQDTLHNAVMSTRPSVISKAIEKSNKAKEKGVDELLDYQFFVENKGEVIVGDMADAFVNDGVITVFVPWVREEREVHDIHTIPPIPASESPEHYFAKFLQTVYQSKIFKKKDADGWTWEVLEGKTWFPVDFYTVGDDIEMDAVKKSVFFTAPRPMVKDYEDVLYPARAANLQIPSPSNPGGSAHVIIVDYPTLDEIKRLKASGFYDLITEEDLKKLDAAHRDTTTGQALSEQKDVFAGKQEMTSVNDGEGEGKSQDHKTLTRFTCFDIYDIDGDGENEDVIWWVIKEGGSGGILARARELTQVYPADPPRRPFAETSFLPVRDRRAGISLLEMLEGLHDLIKQFADQTIDGGTFKNVPFGFYRASSNMRPETIRMWPGELYPLANPKDDVYFPQFSDQGSAFGFNLMTMFGQMEERLTNIGELQLGRVPQGKSSALRTVRGMQAVLGQGDARPERILRRFFTGLSEVYAQMHELNQVFLPREKQIRVTGLKKPDEDPYRTISGPSAIRGRFQFDFIANAMNTSKESLQQALNQFGSAVLNPLMLQMGIVDADGAYQWARDVGKSVGVDPDKYLKPPSPDAGLPKLFAEEVVNLILAGAELPQARPAEANATDHLKKLIELRGSDDFGYLSPAQATVFNAYLVQLRQRLQAEAQKQAQMAAAAQFQKGGPPGVPGPEGTAPIDTSQAPVHGNELVDESLPGAGGGGNPGPTLQ